jgi:hypothetical protein
MFRELQFYTSVLYFYCSFVQAEAYIVANSWELPSSILNFWLVLFLSLYVPIKIVWYELSELSSYNGHREDVRKACVDFSDCDITNITNKWWQHQVEVSPPWFTSIDMLYKSITPGFIFIYITLVFFSNKQNFSRYLWCSQTQQTSPNSQVT